MIEKIRLYGDEILREKAKEITTIDKKIKERVSNLIETLESQDEFALAAPQIGYSLRMFAVRTLWVEDDQKIETLLFINPEFIEFDGTLHESEGCLSIPGIHEEVKRPTVIRINYLDENFEEHDEEFSGMAARIIQHEYDHLDGILFTDKLSALKKRLLKGKLRDITRGKTNTRYKMVFPVKK